MAPEGMPSVYLPWSRYKERGHDVDVFMVGDFEKTDCLYFEGCHIHLIPRPKLFQRRSWRWYSPLAELRLLIDSIIIYLRVVSVSRYRLSPDVIYVYRPPLTIVGWALAKRYRATFIKRFFGTWTYQNWHHRRLKNKIGCLPIFIRWLWPCDLLIITNDGTNGDKIAELLRIRKSKFRMWLNGVDKERLPNKENSVALRSSLGLSEDKFVLLCLSRLDGWKRQDRVIRAMPLILKGIPSARLVIVGDGPKRQELEEMVKELGLEAHVQFIGMIEHNKVPDMIGIADLFLQTNDLSCLGNTLLEAIACGRPIVTWDVGTTRDILIDNQNGCLMPDAKPETIAQMVVGLAKDPERRNRLAKGARLFAKEHLQSWDERLDMEIGLIKQIHLRRRGYAEQKKANQA